MIEHMYTRVYIPLSIHGYIYVCTVQQSLLIALSRSLVEKFERNETIYNELTFFIFMEDFLKETLVVPLYLQQLSILN